jgi:4a-hydroxytetrahydrobiopterin dehydratase
MKLEKMSNQAILDHLKLLNENVVSKWDFNKGKLEKQFVFPDFISAFGFMSQCAIYCEKVDHHPEWCNVYNKVRVQLITHEVNGISYKDFDLATKMNSF